MPLFEELFLYLDPSPFGNLDTASRTRVRMVTYGGLVQYIYLILSRKINHGNFDRLLDKRKVQKETFTFVAPDDVILLGNLFATS